MDNESPRPAPSTIPDMALIAEGIPLLDAVEVLVLTLHCAASLSDRYKPEVVAGLRNGQLVITWNAQSASDHLEIAFDTSRLDGIACPIRIDHLPSRMIARTGVLACDRLMDMLNPSCPHGKVMVDAVASAAMHLASIDFVLMGRSA